MANDKRPLVGFAVCCCAGYILTRLLIMLLIRRG